MLLAAEYIPSLLLQLTQDARTLLGNRESDPPFSRFGGGGISSYRLPIPDRPGIGNRESGIGNRESGIGNRESGIGKRAVSPFGREPGIGVPPGRGRHAGDFLV
jgi:hypothetical protein